MLRYVLVSFALIAAVGAIPAPAGVFEDIYYGLDLMATPSGFPVITTGDGTQVNGARSGRLRIVPSGLGPGYQLEFDRTFGNDSRGRAEIFHFGGLGELGVAGNTKMTLGYNGKDFRTVTGSVSANNLNYRVRSQNGVQDVELVGTLNLFYSFEVNPLGFYDVSLTASQSNAQLTLDGVVVRDSDDANFDIGPISVSGNIFFDGALAVLTGLGVDVSEFEDAFPRSPVDRINDAIEAQYQEFRAVAGETIEADLSILVTQAVLQGNADAMEALLAGLNTIGPDGVSGVVQPAVIPEPGTLLLVALGGVAIWHRRR